MRDFVQAGVDRVTIKALCGMHTDSIFVRYHIVNDADLAAAVAKRFAPPPAAAPASPTA